MDGLFSPREIKLSPDGNYAYVAGSSDKTVSWFTRNSATGILTYGGTLKTGRVVQKDWMGPTE